MTDTPLAGAVRAAISIAMKNAGTDGRPTPEIIQYDSGLLELVKTAEAAFTELNTIRARDGMPYQVEHYIGDGRGVIGKASVTEEYFAEVVDNLQAAIKRVRTP